MAAGMTPPWRALALIAAAAALSTIGSAAQAGAPAIEQLPAIDRPTAVTKQAVRIRLPNLLAFPMAVQPRCDILDNFGDYRSGGRRHEGVDMLSTLGQPVYAVADGVITQKVFDGTAGSSLSGNLLDVTTTTAVYAYAHLSGFAHGIEVGTPVGFGQLIGFVGDTGNPGAGNYHLHFEVQPLAKSSAINPLTVLTIPPGCRVY